MIRLFAFAIGDLATVILPNSRADWGRAMTAELDHITDDRKAAFYAVGCLSGAAKERVRDFDTQFRAAVASVALVTAAFAIFHLVCAARGVNVLFGRPDGFLAAMRSAGVATPDVVAHYHQALPIVVACLFGLGVASLAGACFLLARRWRWFLLCSCAAIGFAMSAVSIQLSVIWTPDGVPSEFVALIIQSVALPMILAWSNGRDDKHRRET